MTKRTATMQRAVQAARLSFLISAAALITACATGRPYAGIEGGITHAAPQR